eukprot:Filipodium_phascolosomae@DN2832_c0_g1_i1.p1
MLGGECWLSWSSGKDCMWALYSMGTETVTGKNKEFKTETPLTEAVSIESPLVEATIEKKPIINIDEGYNEGIRRLFSTVNQDNQRICMHGVRKSLVDKQANALGLGIDYIPLDPDGGHDDYDYKMMSYFQKAQIEKNVKCFAFGDIFLEDIKRYKISLIEKACDGNVTSKFPLWNKNTKVLAEAMLE